MKLKNNIIALLALAGSAFVVPAQAAVTFTAGDLILAVRSATEAQTYMVNLGSSISYRDATADITSIVNINTDLDAAFPGWENRADVTWSIFGVRASSTVVSPVSGDPGQTIYVSRAETTVGTQVAAFAAPSSTNHTNAAVSMSGIQVEFSNGTPTGLPNATILADASTLYDTAGVTWGAFNSSVKGNFGAGTAGTALDLFRSLGTTTGASPSGTLRVGSYEGTFHINDAGTVSFTTTPTGSIVPEPSRALLLGIGAVGFIFRRRRTPSKA